jgi:hypothetical protein
VIVQIIDEGVSIDEAQLPGTGLRSSANWQTSPSQVKAEERP